MKLMHLKNILAGCLLIASSVANARDTSLVNTNAVQALIKRILPARVLDRFEVVFIPADKGHDVFELYTRGNKVVLAGSNGLSIASALNYYLKNYAHCDVSWNGSNLAIPDPMPMVGGRIRQATPYTYRYYFNYCTFNYSMSWWNWDRWEKEIDWMALNGINMPLALTGQNIIWYRVYRSLGLSDNELESFFSGPAYFNWFWMGNLDGWGGPLPLSWMKSHEALQKKILARQRELGMTPVLPAFTGHVPPAFRQRFPHALLKQTKWVGFPQVFVLDPEDPLFVEIGRRFVKEQTKTYGTDHLYSADTFNENKPPTDDSTYLSNMSGKVYQAMSAGDPQAKWIMQGWLFHFQSDFWKPTQIKALLNAVPNDRMILLDLWSENYPVWNKTEAYYGKPWIWCMLHNFGGKISLYGRMDEVAGVPASLLGQPRSGQLCGIGLTPEGIEQNPVMYALMLENVWRDKPVDLDNWLKDYARRRYGAENADAANAWMILKNTVYNAGISDGGPESILTGRPTFANNTVSTQTAKGYRPGDLIPAWEGMVKASEQLKNSEGFRYDLVDLTRQVLANYADTLQRAFAKAYEENDKVQFTVLFNRFIKVINDMDTLLATQPGFLLGRWLQDAGNWGTNDAEKKLYEKNARNLITLWGDSNSSLHDYSCRQWSGMLRTFYLPRWEQFYTAAITALDKKQAFDQKAFEEKMKVWEWKWVNGQEKYSVKPIGDAVETVRRLYKEYKQALGEYK